MRFLLVSLSLLLLAVLLSGQLLKDTGFVVIGVHGHLVRTSFVVFIVLMLLAVIAGLWSWRLLHRLGRAPRDLRNWSRRRHQEKAEYALNAGFLALVQGDWREAERHLSDGARRSERPLLHYLGAARAAQAQKAPDRQSFYLQMAKEQGPDAELPVLLTQMEAALHEQRLEEARAALDRLREIGRNHDQVLRMELAYRRATGEWAGLLELMPKLARRNLLPAEQQGAIEREAIEGLLAEAEHRQDPRELKTAWERLSRARRQSPEVVARYARALARGGDPGGAYEFVYGALKKQWSGELVRLFGELRAADGLRQQKIAEDWLAKHADEPELLLTLGRLSLRNGLWGKARSYLETVIEKAPSPEAYRLLAEALEQLGDRDAALRSHRQGLELATLARPSTLLPAGSGIATPAHQSAANSKASE
ncbi:MAG: heme biosynthesis HemY N-terminal domain-containing protein [Chromatiales bacterium]